MSILEAVLRDFLSSVNEGVSTGCQLAHEGIFTERASCDTQNWKVQTNFIPNLKALQLHSLP